MSHIVLDMAAKKKLQLPPISINIWCVEGKVARTTLAASVDAFSWQSFDSNNELDQQLASWFYAYVEGSHPDVTDLIHLVDIPPFTLRVLNCLAKLPFGQTITYQGLAQRVGSPNAARAVGSACGRNPVALLIPCHRVVAAAGIGGFSQDPAAKRHLLAFERVGCVNQIL
ncbi:Uncharacterized protein SCG7086_AB_00260 [Chlamydiales bacterium SCGC AG-110-P3]|nr:Uncharacterized protein SCG7086_AB_00260 [Chlamydiales bacterium SCGC AG-110-P3]